MAPASYSLARAIFLSIDSASVSGVALSVPTGSGRVRNYEVERFGECKRQKDRESWVKDAIGVAVAEDLPLVIVGEEWTPHGISTATFSNLCENWGKWLAAIERVSEPERTELHVVRVSPNVWRNAVFGKRRPRKWDDLKKLAVRYAEYALKQPPNLSDNIAEALCICAWAQRAAEVHELLAPKRKRRAA